MSRLTIEIFDRAAGTSCAAELSQRPVDIGRQLSDKKQTAGPLLQLFSTAAGRDRINIAPASEVTISREQLLLEPLSGDRVRATRKANGVPMEIDSVPWTGGEARIVTSENLITLGKNRFEIRLLPDDSPLQSLNLPTLAPGRSWRSVAVPSLDLTATLGPEELAEWFQQVAGVLESAKSNEEFHQNAAEAMVELLHLDSGRVLLLEESGWHAVAESIAKQRGHSPLPRPSARVLASMVSEKLTVWEVPIAMHDESLTGVEAVVAAPILDCNENVIGALYGDRRGRGKLITRLEAMLVRMLACGVAAGIARLEQQQAATAAQIRFEQFFTENLSRHLTAQPDLLAGRDAEVTVLFCDIRGFSRISNRLRSAAALVEWLSEVMSVLSDCVVAEEGVLVDYIGDELMAMWGAPAHQPDHAVRACRAGIAMLNKAAEVSPQWQELVGEPTNLGIGINSGPAFVGNTGSRRKFKYGPLGTTVNMGSRVQGATKHFGSQMIVTAATRQALNDDFFARRLRLVNVVNIAEPVELYELVVNAAAAQQQLRTEYEAALAAFENDQYPLSVGILGQLLTKYPDDVPSRLLLSHASEALLNPQGEIARVWTLPSK